MAIIRPKLSSLDEELCIHLTKLEIGSFLYLIKFFCQKYQIQISRANLMDYLMTIKSP